VLFSDPVRRGGLAAVAAGALFVVVALLPGGGPDEAPLEPLTALEYLTVALAGAASLLLLGGIAGLRAAHAGAYGGPRVPGFRLAFFGTLLYALLLLGPAIVEGVLGRAPTAASVVIFGFLASLAAVAADFGILLMGIAALRSRVLPQPYRSLPLAIFALDLVVPLVLLLVLRGDTMFRGEPDEGVAAFLVWQAPGLLVGGCWVLLGHTLRKQTPSHRTS
jgi:hypothetical protein